MDIEVVIVGIVVLALVAVMYRYWPKAKDTLDVNHDGKIDVADAKAAVAVVEAKVEESVKAEVAKVVEESKAIEAIAEEIVKTEVKKITTKAKAAAKKAADVNEDGKVDVADVVAAVKKGGRPKKSV